MNDDKTTHAWTFVLAYIIGLIAVFLIPTIPGGRATWFGIIAVFSCAGCICRRRDLQLTAIGATIMAVGLTIWDHEMGKRYKTGRESFLESRLRECEEKLSRQ
jgi:hypothetical protein